MTDTDIATDLALSLIRNASRSAKFVHESPADLTAKMSGLVGLARHAYQSGEKSERLRQVAVECAASCVRLILENS